MRATRLAQFLTASDKDYIARIQLGLTTDTYDVTGRERSRADAALIDWVVDYWNRFSLWVQGWVT